MAVIHNSGRIQSKICTQSLSHVQLFLIPWTVARKALSMRFPRQEYWSGLTCLPPGDLPTQGWNPQLLCLLHQQADSLPLSHLGSPMFYYNAEPSVLPVMCVLVGKGVHDFKIVNIIGWRKLLRGSCDLCLVVKKVAYQSVSLLARF